MMKYTIDKDLLLDRMKARDYNFETLSTATELGPASIGAWIGRRRDTTPQNWKRICDALDLSLDEIVIPETH